MVVQSDYSAELITGPVFTAKGHIRGFDDLTLTFYETKLCDHDKGNL